MLQDCKILGLDVSTKSTGWSIVSYKNNKMEYALNTSRVFYNLGKGDG